MNSKLLYAATLALSLVSTLALAQQAAPPTRAQVNAETRQAIADGTLRRTDYDEDSYRPLPVHSELSRAQVEVQLARDHLAREALVGPQADRNYNPYGTEVLQTSTLARSTVKGEVSAAAASGTLQRTDYDDAALLARRADEHVAGERVAQRLKAKLHRQG